MRQGLRARQLVARPSLRELALEEIRLAITTGQLDEGRTYSAAGLAKELGMSLSPVREAMMSLVSEGTVEAIPNRGFRLRPISADDLEEIIRIRIILSTAAAAELCARARASHAGGKPDDGIDRDFHRLLLEYGLGQRAADISLRLRDQSRIVGLGRPPFAADRQTAQDLIDIVELLRAGRTDDAQRAVTRNLYWYKRIVGRAEPDDSAPAPR